MLGSPALSTCSAHELVRGPLNGLLMKGLLNKSGLPRLNKPSSIKSFNVKYWIEKYGNMMPHNYNMRALKDIKKQGMFPCPFILLMSRIIISWVKYLSFRKVIWAHWKIIILWQSDSLNAFVSDICNQGLAFQKKIRSNNYNKILSLQFSNPYVLWTLSPF